MRSGVIACIALIACATPAWADPADPAAPDVQPAAAEVAPEFAPEAVPPPVDDGKVASSPPKVTKSPDGWTLTLSAREEIQRPVAPLTTAISTREYQVGGLFEGSLQGPGTAPKGVLEVGYQIGCGIDMSTGNGVALGGNAAITGGLGTLGPFSISNPFAALLVLPTAGVNIGGNIAVSLKPGIVNVVPVAKKTFTGAQPWVSITNQRIKIDGCVGQSFIRSYAIMSKTTDEGDAIAAWYGVTKQL